MTEPHRFISIMTCLKHIARQIVQQTPSYSQGQTYVLPLLMSVLPGIDLNDFKKTLVTSEFLDIIFMLITCVDCSSAVNTRNDLTEVRFNFKFEKKMDKYYCFCRLKKKCVYQQQNLKI
jgi:proteasome activator subunit 4